MILRVSPVTLAYLENYLLRLARQVRGWPPSKMEGTEPPKLVVFVLPLWPGVDDSKPKRMPLRSVSAKIIEHRPNMDIPLF